MPSIAVTDIELISQALVLIGLSPIQSFGDDDKSQACKTIFPMVKKEVLGKYPWRCTIKKVRLSKLSDAPNSEWEYQYTLPSDRLSGIRAVFDSPLPGARTIKEYDISGGVLLANIPSVWVDYQRLVLESDMDAHIQVLFSYVLASRLAEILTDDSSKSKYWNEVAYGSPAEKGMGGYFESARLIDSQTRPSQEIAGDYSLIDVRG